MPATELLPIDIASLTDGMGTPIVALAKLLAVSNFYRDVLGYDAFGDDNKAVAIVANDHRGGKDSNNASAGYGRSKIFTRISVGATCSPTIDTLGHEVTHAVEQSISRMTYEGESGALMEAISDIMGEIIEDWYNDSPKRLYPDILRHWDIPLETSLKWLDGDISWILGLWVSLSGIWLTHPAYFRGMDYLIRRNTRMKTGASHKIMIPKHSFLIMGECILIAQ